MAFVGSPPNCFHHLYFGYKGEPSEVGSTVDDEPEEESDLLAAFCKVMQKSPAAATVPEQKFVQTLASTSAVKGSGTDSIWPQGTQAMTRAIIFRPGRDKKQWSRTGLTQEYHPITMVLNTAVNFFHLPNMNLKGILTQWPPTSIKTISITALDATSAMNHFFPVKVGRNIMPTNMGKRKKNSSNLRPTMKWKLD